MELVRPIDVRGDSGIDIRSERVKLYVIEREKFDTELQRLGIQLPHIVDVITVGYLATAENNIYGGLALQRDFEK